MLLRAYPNIYYRTVKNPHPHSYPPVTPVLLFRSMFSQAAQAAFLFLQDLRFGARIAQV